VTSTPQIDQTVATVPPGAWAVAVSGGADSVAMLSLLRPRSDLSLRVVHLDHQTRQGASTEDARFVESLARRWNLPCDIGQLDEVEREIEQPNRNRSARFRAARIALFKRVVSGHQLSGVILAHHALDQAETILLRLLRGSSYVGLGGMSARSSINGLNIVRPFLGVSPLALREHLRAVGQEWREDQSNLSPAYARNRIRIVLQKSPELSRTLIEFGESCRALQAWTRRLSAPPEQLSVEALADLPGILAREQARRWLIARGSPAMSLEPKVLDRLIEMARDRSTPPRQHFPGRLLVRRKSGRIFVG
jgi:tRNA(Ile)-lysidine synthetase-like protein